MRVPQYSDVIEAIGTLLFFGFVYLAVQYVTVVYFTTWASGPSPRQFEWEKGWEEFKCIYVDCEYSMVAGPCSTGCSTAKR
jgi:hypothetical protein